MEAVLMIVLGALGTILATEIDAWIPWACTRLIAIATRQLPRNFQARMQEEWTANLNEIPGKIGKLFYAADLVRVGRRIPEPTPGTTATIQRAVYVSHITKTEESRR